MTNQNQPQAGAPASALIGTPSVIPGITANPRSGNKAPIVLVAGREKEGKSTTVITSLFGFGGATMQPLVLAADSTGPDSCLAVGYVPHAIKFVDLAGRWYDKLRSALDKVEQNIAAIRKTYNAIVFDCASTLSYRLLEDARRFSKNKDPRSHYQDMYTQFNEAWWRLADLEMPIVWLAWTGEPAMTDEGRTEYAAPDIAGKRFARTIAGRAHHVLLLERRKVGVGTDGADRDGYLRLFHTKPWNNNNAGGRYAHVLAEPMPAHMGNVLGAMLGG